MLILSRRVGEEIVVTVNGKRTLIQVTQVRGDRVWLGFTTEHRDITIDRLEVDERKRDAMRQSTSRS